MKNKMITLVSTVMLFAPWTILPLRSRFQWALDYAHIMIPCYAVFMILSGVFTVFSYVRGKVQNHLMKICLIGNILYAVFGAVALGLMLVPPCTV
ncbi:MAG: hypothetical protein NC541_05735 [bacterium]|nr:hypothetical protein [bacterium]